MSLQRYLVPVAVIALSVSSVATAGNRANRRAVRASRPYRAAAVNPYVSVGYRGAATTGDVQSLTQAYSTLASADHDYQGHRVKAMEAIKKAAKLMGQKITGEGKVKEPQALSDAQLRGVQSTLQKVKSSVGGRRQQRVVQHINDALQHLSVALSIK
jgi:hypothetical protein